MAWTAPSGHVYATGEIVSAATLNTYVKDNLIDLDRRSTAIGSVVATAETRTNVAYGDLATVGPSATFTVGAGGLALIFLYANLSNSGANGIAPMGFAISGATTIAATDATALAPFAATAASGESSSAVILQSGLTAGSNTATAKYRAPAGTGTWSNRRLAALPIAA